MVTFERDHYMFLQRNMGMGVLLLVYKVVTVTQTTHCFYNVKPRLIVKLLLSLIFVYTFYEQMKEKVFDIILDIYKKEI